MGSSVEIQRLKPRELARCPRKDARARRAGPGQQLLKQRFPFKELLISSALRVSGPTNSQQPAQSSKFPPLPSIVLHKHNHFLACHV